MTTGPNPLVRVASRGLPWYPVASFHVVLAVYLWYPVGSRAPPCPPVVSRGVPFRLSLSPVSPPVVSRGIPFRLPLLLWYPVSPPVASRGHLLLLLLLPLLLSRAGDPQNPKGIEP